MKKKFSLRSFISFSLFFSFFMIVVTGIVLYIAPPGRVARWDNWSFLGFTKDLWQAQHTIFSYCFLFFGIIHVFSLNWRALIHYVKARSKKGLNKKRELIFSTLLFLMIFIGTWTNIFPFRQVMDLGEKASSSWENSMAEPPIPHTESLSLDQMSEDVIDRSLEEMFVLLEERAIRVDSSSQTLASISKNNPDFSPAQLFEIISKDAGIKLNMESLGRKSARQGESVGRGGGFGRLTIREIARDAGISVDKALESLKKHQIKAGANDRIRDIASGDYTPGDIYQIIIDEN